MTGNKCSVENCPYEVKEACSPHRSMHSLPPKDQKKLRRRWLDVLRITNPVKKRVFVCDFHFKETDFFPSK